MRSVTVRLDDLRTMILNLGFVGENEHRKFNFDCKKMFGEYPSASVSLTVQPPAGDCYQATVERNGDMVSWTVTDSDLIEEGCGEIQLTFMVGEVVAKTCIGRTKVERSLGATGDIPTPIENWIEQAEEVISEAEDAAEAARDAAGHQPIIDDNGYWAVWDADAEEYVATEYKAQGTDGHDGVGIVSIEKTGTSGLVDTYTITFTSGNPVTYTVTNGRDADPTELIDDEAGAGDTDKVWSADKSSSLLTQINSKYEKPNTGIPATDLEEGVIPDISGKADKTVTDALQKDKAPVIIDSAEGNPIVLTDGADGLPVESMKIHFLPKQDTSGGDPSPSHVCPISGRTGLTVWRTGKNLVDVPDATGITSQTELKGGIFLPAGSYTISAYIVNNGTASAGVRITNGLSSIKTIGYNSTATETRYSGQFTLENASDDIRILVVGSATGYNASVSKVMIEKGSSVTSYEAYTGQSYPVMFPDGQTIYGGTLDAVNGVLTVDRAIVDLGTISWGLKTDGNQEFMYSNGIRDFVEKPSASSIITNIICSNLATVSAYSIYMGTSEQGVGIHSDGAIRAVYPNMPTDDTQFKQAVTGWKLVYPLATPIEISLDPIAVQTILGYNTIWSDANGTIELDYRADTKLWISGHSTTVDSALSDTSENPVQNKVIKTALDGKEPKHNATTVSGATPTITGVENTRYICGECATLSITAPASGCIDVVFESGSTPTVLTVSSAKTGVTAIKWANGFDPTALEANTTYEINILDGEFGVVGEWM